MEIYKCQQCNKSFLNGVYLFKHIEQEHGFLSLSQEKKCPKCANEKVVFIAKTFEQAKEKHHVYYCSSCSEALKIELN